MKFIRFVSLNLDFLLKEKKEQKKYIRSKTTQKIKSQPNHNFPSPKEKSELRRPRSIKSFKGSFVPFKPNSNSDKEAAIIGCDHQQMGLSAQQL
ncbi:hypothetical protein AVEN_101860-1 [Araneus ventricosus]|uniref:Uncharacterized protein n=1 Tax=Araneus ventricosus TaxID=182803 RepID=A0A4Y2DAD9_ARAVE|nr:hypothetical protein AVEN_101860-1 [Araneus ventricosus]